jgi:hypothetical protein
MPKALLREHATGAIAVELSQSILAFEFIWRFDFRILAVLVAPLLVRFLGLFAAYFYQLISKLHSDKIFDDARNYCSMVMHT